MPRVRLHLLAGDAKRAVSKGFVGLLMINPRVFPLCQQMVLLSGPRSANEGDVEAY
jgi:hypothetical protein